MVDLGHDLYIILLELDYLSYAEYAQKIPESDRPREYRTYIDFLRNKGKASKRIAKESEWNVQQFLKDNEL